MQATIFFKLYSLCHLSINNSGTRISRLSFVDHLLLEKDNGEYSNRNGGVSDIKYRFKKYKVLATEEGYPFGQSCFEDREIEHIHHFTLQELSITMSETGEVGDGGLVVILEHAAQPLVVTGETGVRTICKYQSVEQAIYEVAHSACEHQRAANDSGLCVALSDQHFEQEETEYYRYKTERSEDLLANSRFAEFEAIGHSFILDKMQPKPATHYFHIVAIAEMGLYVVLQRLVGENDQQNNNDGVAVLQLKKVLVVSRKSLIMCANIL